MRRVVEKIVGDMDPDAREMQVIRVGTFPLADVVYVIVEHEVSGRRERGAIAAADVQSGHAGLIDVARFHGMVQTAVDDRAGVSRSADGACEQLVLAPIAHFDAVPCAHFDGQTLNGDE